MEPTNKKIYAAAMLFAMMVSFWLGGKCNAWLLAKEEVKLLSLTNEKITSVAYTPGGLVVMERNESDAGLINGVSKTETSDMEIATTAKANQKDTPAKSTGPVNLNTASKNDLMTLDGIGEVKAEDIIEYRQQHGGFATIEEIMNVKGIGQKTFEKNKSRLTI